MLAAIPNGSMEITQEGFLVKVVGIQLSIIINYSMWFSCAY